MRIQVLENYGGVRTDGRRILPGIYDLHDPALFNMGGVLIDEGAAVRLEDGEPEVVGLEVAPVESAEPEVEEAFEFAAADEPEAEAEEEGVSLESLTNAELRDLLDQRGIDHSGAKNKAALLALFEDGL